MNSVDTAIGQGSKEPSPKWRERLRALRLNTPSIISHGVGIGFEGRGGKPLGEISRRSNPARYVGGNQFNHRCDLCCPIAPQGAPCVFLVVGLCWNLPLRACQQSCFASSISVTACSPINCWGVLCERGLRLFVALRNNFPALWILSTPMLTMPACAPLWYGSKP